MGIELMNARNNRVPDSTKSFCTVIGRVKTYGASLAYNRTRVSYVHALRIAGAASAREYITRA